MIDIRPICEDEIPVAREMYAKQCPWAAEPMWAGVFVRAEHGKLTGFIDLQMRVLVANLCAEDPRTAIELISWTDGRLCQAGIKQYEFSVPDKNPSFQKFVEKQYGIQGHRDLPGLTYLVTHGTDSEKVG